MEEATHEEDMSDDKPKVTVGEDGRFHIRCERIEAGKPNMNGRVYSKAVLQKMVDTIQRKLDYGIFFGRLGTSTDSKVKMMDAAFRIMKVGVEDDGRIGADCEILNTSRGADLRMLFDAQGVQAFEMIPCGVGSVEQRDGFTVIGDDYRLASFDIEPKLEQPRVTEGPLHWPDEEVG